MRKILSLYQRNYDTDRLVRDEIVPGAEWVLAGEGIATRKLDGTACLVQNRQLFKRYDVKKDRQIPAGFIAAQPPDAKTGHWPGWVPVTEGPEDRWHREAFGPLLKSGELRDGTYELCGPKVQGNHEGFMTHTLVPHGNEIIKDCPRNFHQLKKWFTEDPYGSGIEGIVWHHPNGQMVKIKGKDFGLKRKA